MSNIYSAKFMCEATASLKDKVIIKPVNETYLYSSIEALREMNTMIDKETKKLYTNICEAESKEEENKLFADYFYQFKNIFGEFANRIQQMKSRMIMSVETKVETWEELFKDDQYIASFDDEFSYSGYKFCHMEESNYPRLNLQKLYQKEFDYIGRLMQDNSMSASPSARLKIIATVCNNFANCSGDKNWIKDLIKEMIDIDEKEINKSYSQCIYNSLRDKYEFNVDKGVLYTCKEALCDYQDIIDAACKLCDALLYELDKVAEDISSYLFRNQDNKLKIKTDTDGIIDRDYRLDTYSMNQLDLFLKNKINQIRKILNVFSVAVGIKFDTAVDYIEQNIDILKTAKDFGNEDEPGSEEDDNDNDDIDSVVNGTSDGEGSEGEGSEDDDSEDESDEEDDDIDDVVQPEDLDDDNFEFGSSDDEPEEDEEPIEEEPKTEEVPAPAPEEEVEEEESEPGFDVDDEDFEEGYLFESELFELEMMYEMYDMHESVKAALLLEEETPNNDNKSVGMDNNQKTADKANIWQKIISKLVSLWNRFKEVITTNAKPKVEYLKNNEKYINTSLKDITGTVTLKYEPNITALENLKVEDLNYSAMEPSLASEAEFCGKYYGEYYNNKGEKSFTDFMKEKILKEGEYKINPTDSTHVKKAYDFCEGYLEKVDVIRKQTEIIQKAERVAKDVSKIAESFVDNFSYYFNEMEDNTEKPEEKKEEGKASPNAGKAGKVAIYFKVSSQVLAAKMTMYQKIFNEYFSFCHWYIKNAGGPSYIMGKKAKEETDASNQNA